MVGVVILPEEMIGRLKKNILPEWRACFWSVIIVGLVAHFYKITNWLPNWDSLVFKYDPQNMIGIGRWFLPIACAPSSFYDLPWLAGLIAIILHAFGAVCVCRIFDVRKKITAALIGALIVSFPAFTSVLMYNYVADGYALAFLFSCLAAMLLTADKPRYIGAAVLIALSAGIYQAYVTVTIMLLLCYLIRESLYGETTVRTLILKSVKFLITGVVGIVLYYLVLTLLLKITGAELLDYQGANSAATLSGLNIFATLYTIKNSFFTYFFDFSEGFNTFGTINIVILALTVILYLTDIIKRKLNIGKILLVVFYTAMLPVGASILAFINSNVDYHNLMKMGFFVFYLVLLLQYERTDFKNQKANVIKLWTILLLCVLLIFNHIVIANVSYHKLNMAYEKSFGTLIRIADRIEQTEGSAECDDILVIGYLPDSEAYSATLPPDMTGTTDGFIIRADDEVVGQSVLCSALNDYCGKNYKFLSGEEKTELLDRIDTDNVNSWPAKDSVFVFDGVIVIKLGDQEIVK